MKNTNTHILLEPYENETLLKEDDIDLYKFIEKSTDLLESVKNSNYNDLDKFSSIDKELVSEMMSVSIPKRFTDISLNIIYQYSNVNNIDILLNELNSKINHIFNLKQDSTIYDVEDMIETVDTFIKNIATNNKNFNDFDTFGSLTSYDNIISICGNDLYSSLIEWISLFPSKLLDMNLDRVGDNPKNESSDNEQLRNKINSVQSDIEPVDREMKQKLIYKIYILYKTIINNIVQTKLFWNKFLDMFEEDNELFEFEEFDDSNINMILCELDTEIRESENESEIDYLFGSEANPMTGGGVASKGASVGEGLKAVGKFFKTFPSKINKTRKQFKLFRMRAKNHSFYMKYMGRIEGLYERYADDAKITENGMKGDPVMVLKEEGHEYISNVSNEFVTLQDELIKLSKKFASISNPKQIFDMIKKFGGIYTSDINKSSEISSKLLRAMRFKVGEIILTKNKIYGYTAQSIAENEKIPPANHAIVSLFVDRPDEPPFKQSVSDVFKSVDSFKLIAKNEKEPIFELTVTCSDILTKGIQEESYNMLKENRKMSKEKMELAIKELVANDENPKKAKRELERQWRACWNALENAYKYTLKIKDYVADLVQSYFIMMTRIDNLCKECIVSLLQVESMSKDGRYNTGHKANSLKAHKEYQQSEDEIETVGEKEKRKMEENNEWHEKKSQMKNRAKDIKKAMAVYRWG